MPWCSSSTTTCFTSTALASLMRKATEAEIPVVYCTSMVRITSSQWAEPGTGANLMTIGANRGASSKRPPSQSSGRFS